MQPSHTYIMVIFMVISMHKITKIQTDDDGGNKDESNAKTELDEEKHHKDEHEHDEMLEDIGNELIAHLLTGYQKHSPPSKPTEVKVGLYIHSMDDINEMDMKFSVSIYLRQEWIDDRLKFDPESKHLADYTEMIKLERHIQSVWMPDLFFRNEREADFHYITVPNKMLRLYSTGRLYYVTKISATYGCVMDLFKFPMDTQICSLLVESFAYTNDTLAMNWIDRMKSIEASPKIDLPQFTLQKFEALRCDQEYSPSGKFSCLEARFMLKRDLGYYVLQVYMPTALIVVLSWIAFWISCDATPARVTISLLSMLAITTQATGTVASLPRVSYIKAIDVWLTFCVLLVCCAFLEFAMIHVLSHKRSLRSMFQTQMSRKNIKNMYETSLVDYDEATRNALLEDVYGKPNRSIRELLSSTEGYAKARGIDKLARILFPAVFLLFCAVYWIMYGLIL